MYAFCESFYRLVAVESPCLFGRVNKHHRNSFRHECRVLPLMLFQLVNEFVSHPAIRGWAYCLNNRALPVPIVLNYWLWNAKGCWSFSRFVFHVVCSKQLNRAVEWTGHSPLRQSSKATPVKIQLTITLTAHQMARQARPTIPPNMCWGFIPIHGRVSSYFIVAPFGFRYVPGIPSPIRPTISAQVHPGTTVVTNRRRLPCRCPLTVPSIAAQVAHRPQCLGCVLLSKLDFWV